MKEELKLKIQKIEGANLRRLREERGLTQEGLSELVKTSPKALSPLENGRRGIGPGMMRRLCEALGVDETEITKGTETIMNDTASYIDKDIRQLLAQLPEIRRYEVAVFIKKLLTEEKD